MLQEVTTNDAALGKLGREATGKQGGERGQILAALPSLRFC